MRRRNALQSAMSHEARRGAARRGKVTWVGAAQHNHRERMTGENTVLREQLRKAEAAAPPPSPPGTEWTRRVPHPVLIGHAASLTRQRTRSTSAKRCELAKSTRAQAPTAHALTARWAPASHRPLGGEVLLVNLVRVLSPASRSRRRRGRDDCPPVWLSEAYLVAPPTLLC